MIQIKNLTAGYHRTTVLRNVSLELIPGQVLVLLGPNGCGKSTLLKAALGLLRTTEGEILYDGVNIRLLKRRQIAQKVAFLTQSRNTPSIQALRMVLHGRFPYLSYPRQYTRQDVQMARNAMELTSCRAYEDINVSELSGGQRQAVYLAMALAQDTETVLMDEPTTFLDIRRQLQTMEIARVLANEGKAVVLVLHDLTLALRSADRIGVLQKGELLMCDVPEVVYRSGVLNQVFDVCVHGVDSPHGIQYYCVSRED